MASIGSGAERLSHGSQHILVRGKPHPGLLSDPLTVDPHGELATASFDEFGIGADRILDERRRTGSARPIVSKFAVANLNRFHRTIPQSAGADRAAFQRTCDLQCTRYICGSEHAAHVPSGKTSSGGRFSPHETQVRYWA